MAYRNGSGYSDPTFGAVLSQNRQRKKLPSQIRAQRRERDADDVYRIIKDVVRLAGFDLKNPIMIQDKVSGSKHYFPKAEEKTPNNP